MLWTSLHSKKKDSKGTKMVNKVLTKYVRVYNTTKKIQECA